MSQRFRLLTEHHVASLLPPADLIPAMEAALAQFSAGEVQQPVRTVLSIGQQKAYFGVMPAYVAAPPQMGAKLVTVFGDNLAKGLPSHLATILLFDPETGALAAVMDGRYITEARTAAVSAVSVKHLARPDASVLAIIGSGVQARSHLEAIRHVRNLSDVRVWSPTAHHRDAFVASAREATGLAVRGLPTAAEAVRGADLIVIATSSRTPVIDANDVAAGAHIAAVGACRPDQREMPTPLIARARRFVDSKAAAQMEAGDLLIPVGEGAFGLDHVAGELGDVVAGRVKGRSDKEQTTIFKSLGLAVEDMVSAHLALTRARTAGIGRPLAS